MAVSNFTVPRRAPGRRGVTNEIIEVLRGDIASGRLTRGERLPTERELARHFSVSQSTIREAIRALVAIGLVDVRHGSGAYVRADPNAMIASSLGTLLQVERVGILDVLDMRAMLSRASIVQATERATEVDIEALRSTAVSLENAHGGTIEEIADHIVEFHVALSACCRNPLLHALEAFLIRITIQVQLFENPRGLAAWKRRSAKFADDRCEIVDAVAARHPKQALKAMEAYLADQREIFASDPEFAQMRLSDPKALRLLAAR